jgi:hypothetical protein
MFVQEMLCITTPKELYRYLAVVTHNKAFARSIKSLEIRLKSTPSISTIHPFLSRVSQVDMLIVDLPPISAFNCSRIFDGLQFSHLTSFYTKTLPHKGLSNFLQRHPVINSFVLGKCGSKLCPITPPVALTEIDGPIDCVASLIRHNPVSFVTARYQESQDSLPRLLLSFFLATSNITLLDITFSQNDLDILDLLAITAPQVSTLRLSEMRTKRTVSLFVPLTSKHFEVIHRRTVSACPILGLKLIDGQPASGD